VEPADPVQKPRRPRGVRLTDLDRSKVYRIAHNGRRWETLGPEVVSGSGADGGEPETGASEARPGSGPPRHPAPGQHSG
jgi:hypothetical protein